MEINWNKYLTLVPTDEIKDTWKKYEEKWNKIKDLIRSVTNVPGDYDEKHIKIIFNSDHNLTLNKMMILLQYDSIC